jgi:hypothetical protein
MVDPTDLLRWGAWRPLVSASRDPEIPAAPGLYRIRRIGRQDLDYIGQTGMGTMTLRKRLGMLRGVYSELVPYRASHAGEPALWVLHHQTGEEFEASVVPVTGSTPSTAKSSLVAPRALLLAPDRRCSPCEVLTAIVQTPFTLHIWRL